jgi:hypothetical protein
MGFCLPGDLQELHSCVISGGLTLALEVKGVRHLSTQGIGLRQF